MKRKKNTPSPGPFSVYVPSHPEAQRQIRDAHGRIIAVSSRYGEHFGAGEITWDERDANMALLAASSAMFDALNKAEKVLKDPKDPGTLAKALKAVRKARKAAQTIAPARPLIPAGWRD